MAFLHGVIVPHRKNTANKAAIKMDAPNEIKLPMVMHIGAPASPVVKAGDEVKVGTLVAEQTGFVSSPVYSSVSGTVKKIDDILLSNGKKAPAIMIESDGKMEIDESVKAPTINSREDLIEAIKNSGMVGLGGAGFPTYVKYSPKDFSLIKDLIINGAECEPYITSDSLVMETNADDILFSIKTLDKYYNFERIIIGIEKNKPEAIKSMKKIAKEYDKIQVAVLPSRYPQGGEKVLVYHTTGKIIGEGKLPLDVGCIVSNSTTIASLGKYFKTGMPLVEKCVTVDGSAVENPQNVIVPIGTSLKDVFDFCGGFKEEPTKVIYGGPMMGIAVPSLELPIMKNTNAIIAFKGKDGILKKPTACIKCGACASHCPFGLQPPAIAMAKKNKDYEALEKLGINQCMECGCCAFVCPANRPIVQNNKLAKMELRAWKEAKNNGN